MGVLVDGWGSFRTWVGSAAAGTSTYLPGCMIAERLLCGQFRGAFTSFVPHIVPSKYQIYFTL